MTDYNLMKQIHGMATVSKHINLPSAPSKSHITPGLCAPSLYSKYVPKVAHSQVFEKQKVVHSDCSNQTGAGLITQNADQFKTANFTNNITTEQIIEKMKSPYCNIDIDTADSSIADTSEHMSPSPPTKKQKMSKNSNSSLSKSESFRFF